MVQVKVIMPPEDDKILKTPISKTVGRNVV